MKTLTLNESQVDELIEMLAEYLSNTKEGMSLDNPRETLVGLLADAEKGMAEMETVSEDEMVVLEQLTGHTREFLTAKATARVEIVRELLA